MGRPRKPAGERRSSVVRFTVRSSEHLRIIEGADRAGLTVSSYARGMVLGGRVIVRRGRSLDYESFEQLRRIGVNLNQAVKLYHATGEPPEALVAAAERIDRLLAEMFGDGAW